MAKEYRHLLYETGGDGITTITLNRPPVNAFNREMSKELILALDRFALADTERVLILTGAGKAFSTGEDLRNINLDASIPEMRQYSDQALRQYHEIVRMILGTGKPIIAALNGVAAGAGMSIALACDQRFALVEDYTREAYDASIFVPAFSDMGLVADSGMTATLPRLVGRQGSHKLCDTPGVRLTITDALRCGVIDGCYRSRVADEDPPDSIPVARDFSFLAYELSKKIRNEGLLYELNKRVFPWEFRAQADCITSDYFKEKARAFLAKQKAKEAR